jgi:hypothetical protein
MKIYRFPNYQDLESRRVTEVDLSDYEERNITLPPCVTLIRGISEKLKWLTIGARTQFQLGDMMTPQGWVREVNVTVRDEFAIEIPGNFLFGLHGIGMIEFAELPNVLSIGNYFLSGRFIKEIDFTGLSNVRAIGHNFMESVRLAGDLKFENFKSLEIIGNYFLQVSQIDGSLEIKDIPNLWRIGSSALERAVVRGNIEIDSLPSLKSIGGYGFGCVCGRLRLTNLPMLKTIENFFGFELETDQIEFRNIPKLRKLINVFSGLEGIPHISFWNMPSLVEINSNATHDEPADFKDCDSLVSCNIPGAETSRVQIQNLDLLYTENLDNLKVVGHKSFWRLNFRGMLSLGLWQNLVEIGNSVGVRSNGLDTIDLSPATNLMVIGYDFFKNSGILKIIFGNHPNLYKIGDRFAFGCTQLMSVNLDAIADVPVIGGSFLNGCANFEDFGSGRVPASKFYGCHKLFLNREPLVEMPSDVLLRYIDGARIVIPDDAPYTALNLVACAEAARVASVVLPSHFREIYGASRLSRITGSIEVFRRAHLTGLANLKYAHILDSEAEVLDAYFLTSCVSLEEIEVTMPKLDAIWHGSFSNLQVLKSIRFIAGRPHLINIGSFLNCRALERIEFMEPNDKPFSIARRCFLDLPKFVELRVTWTGLVSIGKESFKNCSSLVEFPEFPISHAGESFLEGAKSLEKFYFAPGSTLTKIDDAAFKDCTALRSVSAAHGVQIEAFNRLAFANCTSLEYVGLFGPWTKIFQYESFRNCTSLKKIDLTGLQRITQFNAFRDCTGLEELKLPDLFIFYFAPSFLENCTSLRRLDLKMRRSRISLRIRGSFMKNCTSLEYISIDGNVLEIEEEFLSGCNSLIAADLSFLAEVTDIGHSFCRGCTKLESLVVPELHKCERIGHSLFAGCETLKHVSTGTFPKAFLDSHTFENCTGLEEARVENLGWCVSDAVGQRGAGPFQPSSYLGNTSLEYTRKEPWNYPLSPFPYEMFTGCTGLKRIYLNLIGWPPLDRCPIVIPDGVKLIVETSTRPAWARGRSEIVIRLIEPVRKSETTTLKAHKRKM